MKKNIKIQNFQKLFAGSALTVVLLLPVLPVAVHADWWDGTTCVTNATRNTPPCPATTTTDFKSLVSGITTGILAPLIPLIIGLAVIVFLWGVLRFIVAAGDVKKREEGRNFIIWGLIGITIMLSIWGLVKILTDTLNLDDTKPAIPQLS